MPKQDSISNSLLEAVNTDFVLSPEDLTTLEHWLTIRNVALFFKNIDFLIDVSNPEDLKLAAAFKVLVNNYDKFNGQIIWRKAAKAAKEIIISRGIKSYLLPGLITNLVFAQDGTGVESLTGVAGRSILGTKH